MSNLLKTKDTPRRRLITAAIFCTLGCVFAGMAWWILMADFELDNKGIETQATILSKFTKRRYSKNSQYSRVNLDFHVRYQFKTPSGRHRDSRVVSAGFYKAVKSGDRIPVRYLPQDPGLNEIEASTFSTNAIIAGGFGTAFFLFAGIVLLLPKKRDTGGHGNEHGHWGRSGEQT